MPWFTHTPSLKRHTHALLTVILIVNCKTPLGSDNLLFSGGTTKPGFFYPASSIATNAVSAPQWYHGFAFPALAHPEASSPE